MTLVAALSAVPLFFLAAVLLPGQQQTTGSKTRAGDNANAVGNVLGEQPESVLEIAKVKGKLSAIDLKKRTITVVANKDEEGLTLQFAQPQGREQIKVDKKAAKALGKKKLTLEELPLGSKVRLEYYPVLGQVMELIVEEPAGAG
jgi:hypothetical protein